MREKNEEKLNPYGLNKEICRRNNPSFQSINVAMCLFHSDSKIPLTSRNQKKQDITTKINLNSPSLKKINPNKIKEEELKNMLNEIKASELKIEDESHQKYYAKIKTQESEVLEYQKKRYDQYKTNPLHPKKYFVKKVEEDKALLEYYAMINKKADENILKEQKARKSLMKAYYEELQRQMKHKKDLEHRIKQDAHENLRTSLDTHCHEDWSKKRQKVQEEVKQTLIKQIRSDRERKVNEKYEKMKSSDAVQTKSKNDSNLKENTKNEKEDVKEEVKKS